MWRGSIDIMQISGHKNVASINNYSTLSEERHKNISNILCILQQCKYIKEKKLIPVFWTLHRFQWKIGIYFYRIK
jgi:hypothetical protein